LCLSQLCVDVDVPLARDRQGARQRTLRLAQASRVLQLAGRVAKAQVEQLLAEFADLVHQLLVVQVADFLALHQRCPTGPLALQTWSAPAACDRPAASPRGQAAPA